MAGQPFSGQVAIVTGGAQGLGRAISEMLVKNGASLMLFDIQQTKMEETCADLRKMEGSKVECVQVSTNVNVVPYRHNCVYTVLVEPL